MCECCFYPWKLEPPCSAPLGMNQYLHQGRERSLSLPKADCNNPVNSGPEPLSACSQECLAAQHNATSRDRPPQYKSSSSFLSLAPKCSAAAGRKGSRAAKAKRLTSHKPDLAPRGTTLHFLQSIQIRAQATKIFLKVSTDH